MIMEEISQEVRIAATSKKVKEIEESKIEMDLLTGRKQYLLHFTMTRGSIIAALKMNGVVTCAEHQMSSVN